jgi:hypothetical protein
MQAHARIPMPAEAKKAADEAVAQVLIIELAQCWDKAQGRLERAAIAAAARKYVHLAGVSRRQWDEMVKTGEAGNA